MNTRKTAIILTILFVVIIAGSFFLHEESSNIYEELNSVKLIPQPERFTELFFENASDLPHETVAGHPISFAFTIHNVEYATTTYPYQVYFESPDGSQINFANGVVTLASDASVTIPVSYTFHDSNLTGEVVVNLPSQNNQSIDFLLPDNNE